MIINKEELAELFDFLIEKGFYCRNCGFKYCLHITKKELIQEIENAPTQEDIVGNKAFELGEI